MLFTSICNHRPIFNIRGFIWNFMGRFGCHFMYSLMQSFISSFKSHTRRFFLIHMHPLVKLFRSSTAPPACDLKIEQMRPPDLFFHPPTVLFPPVLPTGTSMEKEGAFLCEELTAVH